MAEKLTKPQRRLLTYIVKHGYTRRLHGGEWKVAESLVAKGLAEFEGEKYYKPLLPTQAGREAIRNG